MPSAPAALPHRHLRRLPRKRPTQEAWQVSSSESPPKCPASGNTTRYEFVLRGGEVSDTGAESEPPKCQVSDTTLSGEFSLAVVQSHSFTEAARPHATA